MKGTQLWAVVLVRVLGLWGVVVAGEAYGASCGPSVHAVLWSYPADGAEGVPTNLPFFWALTSWEQRTGPGAVTLNGEPLQKAALGQYALPALSPRTRYEVVIEPTNDRQIAGNQPVVLTFTTGDGPQAVPAPPTISARVVEVIDPLEGLQRDACILGVIRAQLCQDSQADVSAVLHMEAQGEAEIIAWQVPMREGVVLWPVTCQPPMVWLREEADGG